MQVYTKQHPDFVTTTCLEWKPILADDRFKEIIISSLRFSSIEKRVVVYGFVIMRNHFHLIWQILGDYSREDVQRDFLKFTGQQILKHLRNESSAMLEELIVDAKDRKRQVWERNSLSVPLWSKEVMWQKLDYIHNNPVRAGLCSTPEAYKYSSAGFYFNDDNSLDFLVHIDG
jgi:REP element-mobilizing transposase RayT